MTDTVPAFGLRCRVHKLMRGYETPQPTAWVWVTATPADIAAGKIPCSMYPTALHGEVKADQVKAMFRAAMADHPGVKAAEFEFSPINAPAYREEPTAAGIQLCIPGTERRPVDNGKPAQLSLW